MSDSISAIKNFGSLKTMSAGRFLGIWLSNSLLDDKEERELLRYYRRYVKKFSPYLKNNYTQRLTEITDLIEASSLENKTLDILDIGCGCGTESLYFAAKGAHVTGLDPSAKRISVAESRKKVIEEYTGTGLDCRFISDTVFDFKPDKKYDVIWMMETFHHIEPRDEFITLLPGLLKNKGLLIISEANYLNPMVQLDVFLARGFKTVEKKVLDSGKTMWYGKERILRAGKLKKILEPHGIKASSIRYFRLLPESFGIPGLEIIEKNTPQALKCFFIHYNYVGKKM